MPVRASTFSTTARCLTLSALSTICFKVFLVWRIGRSVQRVNGGRTICHTVVGKFGLSLSPYLSVCLCLSVCVSVCLSVCLSLAVCQSISLDDPLSFFPRKTAWISITSVSQGDVRNMGPRPAFELNNPSQPRIQFHVRLSTATTLFDVLRLFL